MNLPPPLLICCVDWSLCKTLWFPKCISLRQYIDRSCPKSGGSWKHTMWGTLLGLIWVAIVTRFDDVIHIEKKFIEWSWDGSSVRQKCKLTARENANFIKWEYWSWTPLLWTLLTIFSEHVFARRMRCLFFYALKIPFRVLNLQSFETPQNRLKAIGYPLWFHFCFTVKIVNSPVNLAKTVFSVICFI